MPSPGQLGDHVAGRVDHIGVVAGTADHGVVAGAAIEHVVAREVHSGYRSGKAQTSSSSSLLPVSTLFPGSPGEDPDWLVMAIVSVRCNSSLPASVTVTVEVVRGRRLVVERGAGLHPHLVADHFEQYPKGHRSACR